MYEAFYNQLVNHILAKDDSDSELIKMIAQHSRLLLDDQKTKPATIHQHEWVNPLDQNPPDKIQILD